MLFLLLALAFVGCCPQDTTVQRNGMRQMPVPVTIATFTFRGHDYIKFYTGDMTTIVHDPDCSCHHTYN